MKSWCAVRVTGATLVATAFCVGMALMLRAQTAQFQLMPSNAVPPVGTFYSIQLSNYPPLPFDPFPQLDVYALSGAPGRYWYDDRGIDYAALRQQQQIASALSSMDSQSWLDSPDGPPPLPGGGGTNGGGGGGGAGFQGQVFTTNDLWLQVVGTTNGTTALVINTPWNEPDGSYDLFATTNLAPGAWQWVMRTAAGQTNVTATGLAGPNGFFILGTMLPANDGSGLTVAYENLVGSAFSSDGYGTPNAWYLQNNLNPLASGVATQDPNQDGLANWEEYLWGSDPQVAEGFGVWVSTPSGTTCIP